VETQQEKQQAATRTKTDAMQRLKISMLPTRQLSWLCSLGSLAGSIWAVKQVTPPRRLLLPLFLYCVMRVSSRSPKVAGQPSKHHHTSAVLCRRQCPQAVCPNSWAPSPAFCILHSYVVPCVSAGTLPECMGSLNNFEVLNSGSQAGTTQDTRLHGTVPVDIGQLSKLHELKLVRHIRCVQLK
jgi:hypothetical protein